MKVRRSCPLLAALAFCAGMPLAHSQTLPASVRACAAEADDKLRLSCYDREVARLATASPGASLPAPAALSDEDQFGLEGELARKRRTEQGIELQKPRQLVGRVAGISRKPRGELIIQLDNGQVWEQTEDRPDFLIRTGDKVTITPGALGSFWLAASPRLATRVRRTR